MSLETVPCDVRSAVTNGISSAWLVYEGDKRVGTVTTDASLRGRAHYRAYLFDPAFTFVGSARSLYDAETLIAEKLESQRSGQA